MNFDHITDLLLLRKIAVYAALVRKLQREWIESRTHRVFAATVAAENILDGLLEKAGRSLETVGG